MQELENEHSNLRFDLKLPDNKHRNINGMNYIPESRIAQRLDNELAETTNNSNNMTTIGCNHIIVAFKRIFNKYVDSNHATFMINISSKSRKILTQLLDSEYYQNNFGNDNHNHNHNDTDGNDQVDKKSLTISLTLHKLLNRTSNNNIDARNEDITKSKSLINAQFEAFNLSMTKKIQMNAAGGTGGDSDNKEFELVNVNKEIYKWVLTKLILATEPSVHEISKLMNDSFIRFKMNKRDLFVQLCQKINH